MTSGDFDSIAATFRARSAERHQACTSLRQRSVRNFVFLLWFSIILISPVLCVAQRFTAVDSPTQESLRGLSAPSAEVLWASGTHGTYLRSLDSGKSWAVGQVPGAEQLDFRDVEAFSSDEAYLLSIGSGDLSRVYKTTDGGKHWSLQFTNPEPKGFYDCMAFWDTDHGIAVGDPVDGRVELITTGDGGKTWTALPTASRPRVLEGETGSFAASGTCVMVQPPGHAWFVTGGKKARVFHSADWGKTWSVAETPLTHGNESSGIFSIAFQDAQRGVIGGGDYKNPEQNGPNLAFTQDGGMTWQLAKASPQWFFSAVSFSPGSSRGILAVGSTRAAFLRDTVWEKVWELELNAARFYAPGKAIAVGPQGRIVRFTGLD
jgi:photosystem II stability/assembly factor-like uncharacterized protein